MKKFCFVLFMIVFFGILCKADVRVSALGGDSELQLRAGFGDPNGRTRVGPFGVWELSNDYLGGGVFGTYDIIKPAKFNVLGVETAACVYVGALVGPMDYERRVDDEKPFAVSRLLTGLTLGDEKMQLGLEFQYGLDKDFWRPLGEVDENTKLFACVSWRF